MKLSSIFITSALISSCAIEKGPSPRTTNQLPKAKVGAPYHYTLKAMPGSTPTGNMQFNSGVLPSGIKLTFSKELQSTIIAGMPTQAGGYSFSVSEWCYGTQTSGDHFERDFSLMVE